MISFNDKIAPHLAFSYIAPVDPLYRCTYKIRMVSALITGDTQHNAHLSKRIIFDTRW